MNLESLYVIDEKSIFEYLKNKEEKDKIVRYVGYRYQEVNDEIHLLGFEYTNISNIFLKLNTYIFLKVIVDKELNIKYINLYDQFKGSKGIKCNRDILNNHINKVFLNKKLSLENHDIKDYKLCRCRHIYEILYGMCNFIDYNKLKNTNNSFYYEKSNVDLGLFSLTLNVNFNLNCEKHNYKIKLNNINSAKLDNKYNFYKSNNLKVITYYDNLLQNNKKLISNTKEEFYQRLFKIIFVEWMNLNKKLELNNIFSFTLLWPTSTYSLLMELMTVYKMPFDKNALLECLNNFQIVDGVAQCLGFEGDKSDNI